jgi:hypothetical protein
MIGKAVIESGYEPIRIRISQPVVRRQISGIRETGWRKKLQLYFH